MPRKNNTPGSGLLERDAGTKVSTAEIWDKIEDLSDKLDAVVAAAGIEVTIADGADVTLGAIADASVAAGATGSASAKLRRLTTDLDALLAKFISGTVIGEVEISQAAGKNHAELVNAAGDPFGTVADPLESNVGVIYGSATGGTHETLKDESKNFAVNALANRLIKMMIGGIEYARIITSNIADEITFVSLGLVSAATAGYQEIGNTGTSGPDFDAAWPVTDGTWNLDVTLDGVLYSIDTGALFAGTLGVALAGLETSLQVASGALPTVALASGKIKITSDATGVTSTVLTADAAIDGFLTMLDTLTPGGLTVLCDILPAVDGEDEVKVKPVAGALYVVTETALPATEATLASIKNTDGIKKITDALPAGTNVIGKVGIDQTAGQNAVVLETSRATAVLHRNAVTAVDKVADLANTDLATADNGSATGSLNASTTYYVTAIPGNKYGTCTKAATINSQATSASGSNTHSIRLTIPQKAGAEHYGIFLSTDTAPKWVARVTEAQRAAGDFEVTAVGTVAAGGGNPAGTVDINVAGTGIQTSHAIFAQSNAFTPATPTAIDCTGKTKAYVLVKVALTDHRSAPSLNIIPFFKNSLSTTDWHQGTLQPVLLEASIGQSLQQAFVLDVDSSTGLVILISNIAGQGAACSVWVELVPSA